MTQFTDAEQAFIDATVPVLEAGEKLRAANEEYVAATDFAQQVGTEQLGDRSEEVEYVHNLMLAAAEQAGFGPGSHVQDALRRGFEEYQELAALIEQAQQQVQDAGGAPVTF